MGALSTGSPSVSDASSTARSIWCSVMSLAACSAARSASSWLGLLPARDNSFSIRSMILDFSLVTFLSFWINRRSVR